MAQHEIPLERRTLHGHFSRDLEPILTVDPGDSIAFACLNAGWRGGDPRALRRAPARGDELDAGHALIGPVEVRGARAGQTLEVRIEEVRIGPWGVTDAGGWHTPLNERLGVADGEPAVLVWELDADAGRRPRPARSRGSRCARSSASSACRRTSRASTRPRRRARAAGTSTARSSSPGRRSSFPIPVDGALVSAGDGHAAQGDGEVSQLAIEAPVERAQLTLSCATISSLTNPIAWTPEAWLTFGFDEDLDEAAALAIDGMLELMGREHGLERREALALRASSSTCA